jgi:hypothetical protein
MAYEKTLSHCPDHCGSDPTKYGTLAAPPSPTNTQWDVTNILLM